MQAEASVARAPTKNPFNWSGGHPTLDFVNTLDERPLPAPIERLETYADLVRFTGLAGLISPAQAQQLRKASVPDVAKRARKLREDFFDILAARNRRKAIDPAALRGLAAAVQDARAARTLIAARGHAIARYDWISPQAPITPLHACTLAIENLLTSADAALVRKCGAADC